MFGLSWWHILLVLVVFVLLFGAGTVSGLMADIAKGLKSFKKGLADEDEEAHREPAPVEHKLAEETPRSRRARSKTTKRA